MRKHDVEVPFLDLRVIHEGIHEELTAALGEVTASGWYVLGEQVEAFEAEFAAYVGSKYCIGVGNGLDALRLALLGGGVGAGDEVLVPSNTYIATWFAITQVGATPVPVVPDTRTLNLDVAAASELISPRTKAICPVHLYGSPADMVAVERLAKANDLFVLGDAAQAHGAVLGGAPIGSFGDAAAWSFYPGKNLGALGDGGAVTTDDPALAASVRSLRNYGSVRRYAHERVGTNSRLDEMQAAVLRVKLRHLDGWNQRRRQIATEYNRDLAGTSLVLPEELPDAEPVWHLYVVRSEFRDNLALELRSRGIETLVHYPIPPYRQGAYADKNFEAYDLRLSDQVHAQVLSLPMGPHLDDSAVERVIKAMRDSLQRVRPLM